MTEDDLLGAEPAGQRNPYYQHVKRRLWHDELLVLDEPKVIDKRRVDKIDGKHKFMHLNYSNYVNCARIRLWPAVLCFGRQFPATPLLLFQISLPALRSLVSVFSCQFSVFSCPLVAPESLPPLPQGED